MAYTRPSHYSLRWAWGVFEAFRERYGRGVTLWEQITRYEDVDVVMWLAGDPRHWEGFKKEVKQLADNYGRIPFYTDQHALYRIELKTRNSAPKSAVLPRRLLDSSRRWWDDF
jgi:hypothetical protein